MSYGNLVRNLAGMFGGYMSTKAALREQDRQEAKELEAMFYARGIEDRKLDQVDRGQDLDEANQRRLRDEFKANLDLAQAKEARDQEKHDSDMAKVRASDERKATVRDFARRVLAGDPQAMALMSSRYMMEPAEVQRLVQEGIGTEGNPSMTELYIMEWIATAGESDPKRLGADEAASVAAIAHARDAGAQPGTPEWGAAVDEYYVQRSGRIAAAGREGRGGYDPMVDLQQSLQRFDDQLATDTTETNWNTMVRQGTPGAEDDPAGALLRLAGVANAPDAPEAPPPGVSTAAWFNARHPNDPAMARRNYRMYRWAERLLDHPPESAYFQHVAVPLMLARKGPEFVKGVMAQMPGFEYAVQDFDADTGGRLGGSGLAPPPATGGQGYADAFMAESGLPEAMEGMPPPPEFGGDPGIPATTPIDDGGVPSGLFGPGKIPNPTVPGVPPPGGAAAAGDQAAAGAETGMFTPVRDAFGQLGENLAEGGRALVKPMFPSMFDGRR